MPGEGGSGKVIRHRAAAMPKGKMISLGALACMIFLYGITSPMLPPAYRTPAIYGMVFLLAAAVHAVRRYFPAANDANQDAVGLVVSRYPAAVSIQSLTGRSMLTMVGICVVLWAVLEALTGFQMFDLPLKVHILICFPFLLCLLIAVLMGKRTLWLSIDNFVLESFFTPRSSGDYAVVAAVSAEFDLRSL